MKLYSSQINLFLTELVISVSRLSKSKYMYIALFSFITGAGLNIASQTYLHNYLSQGKTLPVLSDFILDKIPVMNVSLYYDIFALIPIILVIIYVIHKNEYNRVPFILMMSAIFYIVRGIFIILTPFGNPPMFGGSDPLFNGFSRFDLGVYPSGHAGNVFLLFLLVNERIYKWIILFCLFLVIITLFLSHGHYSIDIFSGLFFAYAICSFGEKKLMMFDLDHVINSGGDNKIPPVPVI
jgi:membrane-associated phospholipid phosphatase